MQFLERLLPALRSKAPVQAPSEDPLARREKYPMRMLPDGSLSERLEKFLNSGDRAILDRLLPMVRVELGKPAIFDLMDLSTSIGFGKIPEHIIDAQERYLRPWARSNKGNGQLWQFGFSNDASLLHPEAHGPVDMSAVRLFNRHELSEGALLGSGSRLSDGLFLGLEMALAYRRAGAGGALGVTMITDGWNRNAALDGADQPNLQGTAHAAWRAMSEACAARSLEVARCEGIQVYVLGFVNATGEPLFRKFQAGVGLQPSEVHVTACDPAKGDEVSEAVERTFLQHTRFLDRTVIKPIRRV